MKNLFKYGVVPVLIVVALLSLTLVFLPTVVDFQQVVPVIEKNIQKTIGRPVSLGHDINFSLFPGLALSFSDVVIGNPPGFSSPEFLKIASLEGRIDVASLLRGKLKLGRFVMGGVKANFETLEDGKKNWILAPLSDEKSTGSKTLQLVGSLFDKTDFSLLGITDGQVHIVNHQNKVEHQLDDIMLLVHDFTKNQPVVIDARTTVDGRTVAVEGKIGPLDFAGQLQTVPVRINFDLQKEIHGVVNGKLQNIMGNPELKAAVSIAPFPPRILHDSFDISIPFAVDGKGQLTSLEASGKVDWQLGCLKITEGKARLDDSAIAFSLTKDMKAEPALTFDSTVDSMDLDRYLMRPPQQQEQTLQNDLLPLGGLGDTQRGISGNLRFGQLKIGGLKFDRMEMAFRGEQKVVTIDPITSRAYGGELQGKARIDLKKDIPETRLLWNFAGGNLAQLSNGLLGRPSLAGEMKGDGTIGFYGTNYSQIISTLTGEADIVVETGFFSGFDLNQLYDGGDAVFRGFGAGSNDTQTHFQNFNGDLAFRDGVLESRKTTIRLRNIVSEVAGGVDFVNHTYDVRFIPGGTGAVRSGKGGKGIVPIGLAGTFDQPLLRVGGSTIPANGGIIEKAVEMENLVAAKVPIPSAQDVKGTEGKTLIDPLVIAERIGLQPKKTRSVQEVPELKKVSRPSKIVIHPIRIKNSSEKK